MRIAVYTCVTAGYDAVRPPVQADPRLDYVCFTDEGAAPPPPPWRRLAIDRPRLSARDRNRVVKMFPHEFLPEHDLTIYVDGNVDLVGDLHAFAQRVQWAPEDVLMYDHPYRRCVFDEAAACAHTGHDWWWRIDRQMDRYRALGLPPGAGLFEAGVIVRRNTPAMRAAMRRWWDEYRGGVRRDQLSLPFVAWQRGNVFGSLGRSDVRFTHRFFLLRPHGTVDRSLARYVRMAANRLVARIRQSSRGVPPVEVAS